MIELKETIPMMNSADYKDRFRAEYWQTLLRSHKLQTMLQKHKDGALDFTPDCPIELLHIQLSYMGDYLNVLRERAAIEGVDLSWNAEEPEEPKQEPAKKKYLAVYWNASPAMEGIGNVEVTLPGKPDTVKVIRGVERRIAQEYNYSQVVLLNLIPLEG